MKLTFLSFWAINAPLDAAALMRQMDEMQHLGLDGVVFHPRYYPDQPPYLSKPYMDILSKVILHARDTGMLFWIYDENGWPSGTAGGRMMEKHPEMHIRMLDENLQVLEEPGINVLEEGVGEAFVSITHEAYRKHLDPEAFDWVTGFFTDEAAFCEHGCSLSKGCVPWCEGMPERFRNPALFEDLPGGEEVRKAYWTYVTDLMLERFYMPIRRWCVRYGKQFTGHLKGEENPYFSVSFCGSPVSSLMGFTMPGVDALERFLGNTCFPRLPASVSLQFSDGHALCEAMGGSGWGTGPRDEENYLSALAENGIDTLVLHLQQFSLNEQSLTDWPPSRPLHLTWKDAYPEMLGRVRKKAEAINPFASADVLLVMPARGAMAGFLPRQARGVNEHDGDGLPDVPAGRFSLSLLKLTDVLHENRIRFDLTDEMVYEKHARRENGKTRLGRRTYGCVICADGADLKLPVTSTPSQSPWRIRSFEGERRVPSSIARKDSRHFLLTFDAPAPDFPAYAEDGPGNLLSSGYGLCPSVTLAKTFRITEAMQDGTLLFTGIAAAAARVRVDGEDTGCMYGPDWSLEGVSLSSGEHIVELTLFNSGFNVHGPHHYYLGDAPLTSPLHYAGKKHFGDPDDAPENTHVTAWHFVDYFCFGQVHLLPWPVRRDET